MSFHELIKLLLLQCHRYIYDHWKSGCLMLVSLMRLSVAVLWRKWFHGDGVVMATIDSGNCTRCPLCECVEWLILQSEIMEFIYYHTTYIKKGNIRRSQSRDLQNPFPFCMDGYKMRFFYLGMDTYTVLHLPRLFFVSESSVWPSGIDVRLLTCLKIILDAVLPYKYVQFPFWVLINLHCIYNIYSWQ